MHFSLRSILTSPPSSLSILFTTVNPPSEQGLLQFYTFWWVGHPKKAWDIFLTLTSGCQCIAVLIAVGQLWVSQGRCRLEFCRFGKLLERETAVVVEFLLSLRTLFALFI